MVESYDHARCYSSSTLSGHLSKDKEPQSLSDLLQLSLYVKELIIMCLIFSRFS